MIVIHNNVNSRHSLYRRDTNKHGGGGGVTNQGGGIGAGRDGGMGGVVHPLGGREGWARLVGGLGGVVGG